MDQHQSHPTPFESKPSFPGEGHHEQHVSHGSSDYAPKSLSAEKTEPHRLLAACSYLGVLFLFPLLAEKNDDFVNFHLRQGIVMFVLGVLASFGFHYRRGGSMLMLAVVIVSLVAAYRAWRGQRWVLPVIGKYAAKISL